MLRKFVRQFGSLRSLKNAIQFVLRNPAKAWKYLQRIKSDAWISSLFDSGAEHQRYLSELRDSGLIASLHSKLAQRFNSLQGKTVRGNSYSPGAMHSYQAEAMYALIRKRQPEVLIETGVCNGFSSAVILAALARNRRGKLYSIDYPEYTGASSGNNDFWEGKGGAVVPEQETSGWLVPADLRSRWELRLGKSRELLPQLLQEIKAIDYFVHDSEHSYENQIFEFRAAHKHLKSGGLLVASDINWSSAFEVFSKEILKQDRLFYLDHSLAVVVRG